jgi:hypothetical protein
LFSCHSVVSFLCFSSFSLLTLPAAYSFAYHNSNWTWNWAFG